VKFALAIFVAFLATSSAFAHHSFEAEYDDKKPITLTGTVAKVDWM